MKKTFFRIISLVLVLTLCFQPCVQLSARAEKIDLREESSGSAFGYCTAILSGLLASMSTTSSFNVIQLFVRCYLVPTLVKYIVQAIGIKDSKLAAIACVFISTLINSGMDYGASAAGDGAGAAADGADAAAEGADAAAAAAESANAAAAVAEGANTAAAAAQGASAAADAATAAQGVSTAAGVVTEVSSSVAESGGDIAAAAEGAAAEAATEVSSGVAEQAGDLASAAKDATKSIGGYLGSMKDYFSKAATFGGKTGLTGALIDATKAAAYTAVKLYVTEALSGTNKQLAKSVGYLAGLGVGFAVEQGLEYATGVVVGGVDKDKGPTAEKVTDEAALSAKLAQQREQFLTKFLGEAVCQVVVVAGSAAGINEDLLTMGGALTKRLTMDFMQKEEKEKALQALKDKLGVLHEQNASSDAQPSEETNKEIASLEKKIAKAEEDLSLEATMKKALIYGVSDVALRRISMYAPSPLQGAQINLALTGLVQAVAVDSENVVTVSTDENGNQVVSPSAGGKDWDFYGHIIGNSVDQANADWMSMGRGKAKIVGSGTDERLGLEWVSGNDMFFAARYSEYVNDVVNHGTTYAMANQLASSYHNQAVANAYDVVSGEVNQRLYKAKDLYGQSARYQKALDKASAAIDALRNQWDSIKGQLNDNQVKEIEKFLEKAGDPHTWDATTWKDYGLYVANVAAAGVGSSTFVGLAAAGTNGEGSRGEQMDQRTTAGSRAAGSLDKGTDARVLVEAARDAIIEAGEARGAYMSNRMYSQMTAVAEGTVFKDSNGNVVDTPDFVETFSSKELAAERMKALKVQEAKKQLGMLKEDATTMKEIRTKAIEDFLQNNKGQLSEKAQRALENPELKPQERDQILAAELNSDQKEKINNAIKAETKSRSEKAAVAVFEAKGDLNVNARYQTHIGSGTYYDETWKGAPLGREVPPPAEFMRHLDNLNPPAAATSIPRVSQAAGGSEQLLASGPVLTDSAGAAQVNHVTVEAGAVKQVDMENGRILISGGEVTPLENGRMYISEGGSQDVWVKGNISSTDNHYLISNIQPGDMAMAEPQQPSVAPGVMANNYSPNLASEQGGPQYSPQLDAGQFKPYTLPAIRESTIVASPGGAETIIPQYSEMTVEAGAVKQVDMENGRILISGGDVTELEGNKAYVSEGGNQDYWVKAGQISDIPGGPYLVKGIKPGDITLAQSEQPDNISAQPAVAFTQPAGEPTFDVSAFNPSQGFRPISAPERGNTGSVPVAQANHVTVEAGAVKQVDMENGRILISGGELTPLENGRMYISEGGSQDVWVKGNISSTDNHYLISNIQPGDMAMIEPQQAPVASVQSPAVVSSRVMSDASAVAAIDVNEESSPLPTALRPLEQPASTLSDMRLRKIDPMIGYQKPEAIDEEAVEDQASSRPKYPEVNLPKMYVPEPAQQQDVPQVRGEAGSLRFTQMTVAPGAVTQVGDGWIQVTGDITNLEPGENGRQSAYVDAGGSQSYYVQGTVSELPDGSVFIKNIKPGGVSLAESPQPNRSLPAVNLPVYDPKIPVAQKESSPVEGGVTSNVVRHQIPKQEMSLSTEERAKQNYDMLIRAREEIRQEKGFISSDQNRSDLGVGAPPAVSEMVPVAVPQAQQANWEASALYGDAGAWVNSPEPAAPVINQASSMTSEGRDFVVGVDPLPTDMVAAAAGPFDFKASPKLGGYVNQANQAGKNESLKLEINPEDSFLKQQAKEAVNNQMKGAQEQAGRYEQQKRSEDPSYSSQKTNEVFKGSFNDQVNKQNILDYKW
ncbi:MAG: hypothetical protein WC695_08330 [Candidatus Omnitrophota bacterium]